MENFPNEKLESGMTFDFPNPRKIGKLLIVRCNGVINHTKVEGLVLATVPRDQIWKAAIEMS